MLHLIGGIKQGKGMRQESVLSSIKILCLLFNSCEVHTQLRTGTVHSLQPCWVNLKYLLWAISLPKQIYCLLFCWSLPKLKPEHNSFASMHFFSFFLKKVNINITLMLSVYSFDVFLVIRFVSPKTISFFAVCNSA